MGSQCQTIDPKDLVEIPDQAFLDALIEGGVDKDDDQLISANEAYSVTTLRISSRGIGNLEGVEAFVNLDSLIIYMNPLNTIDISNNTVLTYFECVGCKLTSLDISKNLALEYLDCSGALAMGNYLTSLDVSNNSALKILRCSENQLTYLDISNNLQLRELDCGRNQFTAINISHNSALLKFICNNNQIASLDISNNTALTTMISCGNQLTSLDVSNNSALVKLGVDNMPTLLKVCVWTMPFPPPDVVLLSGFSPNITFTTDCGK